MGRVNVCDSLQKLKNAEKTAIALVDTELGKLGENIQIQRRRRVSCKKLA